MPRDVGEVVLDRLERTDDAAELLTLLHVFDGGVEQRPAEALQLCGGCEGAQVEGGVERGGPQGLGGRHLEQTAREIHRRVLLARGGHGNGVSVDVQDEVDGIGVDRERRVRSRSNRRERPGSQSRETFGSDRCQQCGGNRDGFDDRARNRVTPELLERDDEIDGIGTETVVLLGDEQAVDTGLGEALPHRQAGFGVAGVPCADDGGHVGLGEERVDARREVLVGLIECESHRSLGRPSNRSAMTFFWISLVPA